jgi:DNA polymerase-3 subunit gamma/tau
MLKRQAKEVTEEDLFRYFQALSQAENELKWTEYPRYYLEMTLLKLVQMKRLTEIQKILGKISELEKKLGHAEPLTEEEAREAPRLWKEQPSAKARRTAPNPVATSDNLEAPCDEPPIEESPVLESPGEAPAQELSERDKFLREMQKKKPSIASLLSHASQFETGSESIVIGFHERDLAFKEILEQKENRGILESVAFETLKRKVKIEIRYQAGEKASEESAPGEAAPQDTGRLKDAAAKDPTVQAALELFQGQLEVRKPK